MKDRGMLKWKPFNSVVPSKNLFTNCENIQKPNLTSEEAYEYEELLKYSLYNHSKIKIIYLENEKKCELTSTVKKLDPIHKNIYFTNGKIINFRQIYIIKDSL